VNRAFPTLLPALAAALQCGFAADPGADPAPPASIVRIALGAEADERRPVAVPTEPDNTVEIDFPFPVDDWAGRGFTPDTDRFAGDFVIEAARGQPRIFVTPISAGAHRVLHVVLSLPGGLTRGFPIEFIPAPEALAWRKVVFVSAGAAPGPRPSVTLSASPPRTRLREPSPESEIGLIRTLRMLLSTTADGADAIVAANPSLHMTSFEEPPRSFGDFTITTRFALRDSTTDTLGLCAIVENRTSRRLLFDPGSWVIRVGERVYPVRTADFADELEPGAAGAAFLVLARRPDGDPTLLRSDNEFKLSVLLSGSVNPRPVKRLELAGFDPR
jgi:hypothetical protein